MKTILLVLAAASAAHAQGSIPERTFGAPSVAGSEPFRNIAAVRELSDGRVLVVQRGPYPEMMRAIMANALNAAARAGAGGRGGRGAPLDSFGLSPDQGIARVVLYDAALKQLTPVGKVGTDPLDYENPEGLLAAQADTTLLIELTRGEMLVIAPSGKIVGTRQIPGGPTTQLFLGRGSIDRAGRLVYEPRTQTTRQTPAGMEIGTPDSTAIMAIDFKTGATVPLAFVRVASSMALMQSDPASPGAMKMQSKSVPFPTIDDWVMLPDGTLALIRGADLHIDLLTPDGKWHASASIPHNRAAVSDSDKVKFLSQMHMADSMTKSMPMMPRGMTYVRQDPDSFPQFKPPFASRGARAASDGTIWLPAKVVSPAATDGWAVVTTGGKVREIVHFAKGVELLGFGKGVVYVSVNGSRLARIPLK